MDSTDDETYPVSGMRVAMQTLNRLPTLSVAGTPLFDRLRRRGARALDWFDPPA